MNFVTVHDLCIFCNKTGQEIYNVTASLQNAIVELNKNSNNYKRSFETDCAIYDKWCPCLTEEEFIIKNIIE